MTKEEAQQFKERWRLVNEFTDEETRTTPPEVKFRQLEIMFATAHEMGWSEALREGETEVHELWRRLKAKSL